MRFMANADRIGVMSEGELIQLGPPLDIFRTPRNLWVAKFIGAHPINVIDASLTEDGARLLPDGAWSTSIPAPVRSLVQNKSSNGEFAVGVRPEHLTLTSKDGPLTADGWQTEVYTRQILGTDILYELVSNGHILRAVTPTSQLFDIGDSIVIRFDWDDAFVFDRGTGNALV